MTLIGVIGCMVLLVGGMGMKDTMDDFMRILDKEISNYTTKVNLSKTAQNSEARSLAGELNGDWVSSAGVSLEGETVVLEVYHVEGCQIRFKITSVWNLPMTAYISVRDLEILQRLVKRSSFLHTEVKKPILSKLQDICGLFYPKRW